MRRRRLPLGISTLREIVEEDCYYVDKTPFIKRLFDSGKYFFLSRPRRFGKSLFVDTLAEAFLGNKGLFKGLFLENNWDWNKKFPVIRISFAEGNINSTNRLMEHMHLLLDINAEQYGVDIPPQSFSEYLRFGELVRKTAKKYDTRVVVLVDEYDKPILDNLTNPELAEKLRDTLRGFYSVLKGHDAYLKFVFVTGVSKFTKVSIFSDLNNLTDITLDSRFATICGYTDRDLDTVFAPELEGLNREEIRQWYNGYSWLGERVYNPYDILQLFDKREFRAWWFETGTPRFLVDWLKSRNFYTPSLEYTMADDQLISAFDVDYITTEALLWQSGYLTITERHREGRRWVSTLSLPNEEVRMALNDLLFKNWYYDHSHASRLTSSLYDIFSYGDINALKEHFTRLFASIPLDWYKNNPISRYEGYYASVFYSHIAALGLNLIAEDVSNIGQCDLVVRHLNRVYIFEFKVIDSDEPIGIAIKQL